MIPSCKYDWGWHGQVTPTLWLRELKVIALEIVETGGTKHLKGKGPINSLGKVGTVPADTGTTSLES